MTSSLHERPQLSDRALSFTANLAQAAGTYDLCTASGGIGFMPMSFGANII